MGAEGHPIVDNKALFQCPPFPIKLGQSQCNIASHDVFMYGVAIIVCTNNLWDGVGAGSDEGDWIKPVFP